MARKRYTADDVLGYIRRYRAVHASSPTRAQIGRGLNIHLATAAHHVQRLIDRGDAEAVGPLRTIKIRDENLPIVKLGPIRPDESVTDPARSTGTVSVATAAEFTPYPSIFVLISDLSLDAAGLHPGDRVAVTRAESPAPGSIVLARWKGNLLLRRYRKPTRRTISLEPESRSSNHRTVTTTTTDPNLAFEGKVIGALVSYADRESPASI